MENNEWFDDDENKDKEPQDEQRFIDVSKLDAEGLGSLFFSEKQVEIILSETPNTFSKKVLKGQLISEARVRQMIVAQAIGGSSEAQKIVEKWILKIRLDEI